MENNDVRFRKIDERMDRRDRLADSLHEAITALDAKMSALVAAQIRTEDQRASLENALFTVTQLAKSLDKRMDSSDLRVNGSDEATAALASKMSALLDAQSELRINRPGSRKRLSRLLSWPNRWINASTHHEG
jgi:chromosome segregation ATPase